MPFNQANFSIVVKEINQPRRMQLYFPFGRIFQWAALIAKLCNLKAPEKKGPRKDGGDKDGAGDGNAGEGGIIGF